MLGVLLAVATLSATSAGCDKRATLVHRPWLVMADCPEGGNGPGEQLSALSEVMRGLKNDCLDLPPELKGRVGIKAKLMDPSQPPADGEPFVLHLSSSGTPIPYIHGETNALAKDMDALSMYQALVQDSIVRTLKRIGCKLDFDPRDDWAQAVDID